MDKVKERRRLENQKNHLRYNFTSNNESDSGEQDHRIIALVRFLARRAAEADYEELLRTFQHNGTKDQED